MKNLTHTHWQATRDFYYGACTATWMETIAFYDAGYLPLHTTKTLEFIQSSEFKFSNN